MAKFKWHADYFAGLDKTASSVRKAMIQADNADDAERIARAQMGSCMRVEVRRAATAAPVRVIYANGASGGKTPPTPEILSLARKMFTTPVPI
jgi:hypothetical protein